MAYLKKIRRIVLMYFRVTSGTRLMAILGSAAHLPCNITPPVVGQYSVFSIVSLL
jgi:hypothetical protein